MKTFAVGDIHGAYLALLQCLERSGFDSGKDRLIVLGDVCDGYSQVRQCIDELLRIRHCDLVIGNHDLWALDWAIRGAMPDIWISQGGAQTIASYDGGPMPQAHIDFLKSGKPWLEIDGMFFVHGGFNPEANPERQSLEFLTWDRSLLATAVKRHRANPKFEFGSYRAIFLGHTPTESYNALEPLHVCNVWDLDTGAGWSGKLTIMNIHTKEYWQSDLTPRLYGIRGR